MKAAFGEVVDVRAVPSRSVTRIVIELPIEAFPALAAMLFGKRALVTLAPDDLAVPFGIVDSEPSQDAAPSPENGPTSDSKAPSGPFSPMPEKRSSEPVRAKAVHRPDPDRPRGGELAKWAGILCNDPLFWAWIGEKMGAPNAVECAAEAATWLRSYCEVKSRAELDSNPQAAAIMRFDVMAAFSSWKKRTAA